MLLEGHLSLVQNLLDPASAGQGVTGAKGSSTLAELVALRKRYYAGEHYVDIAGIDIYPTNIRNYPEPWDTTYGKAYKMMAQVAAGKMLALCETAALGYKCRKGNHS